jgi:hypothetical protein
MRTRTSLAVLAVAALVALAGTNCKKKGKGDTKDKGMAADMAADMGADMGADAMKGPMGGMSGMDAPRPRPRVAAKPSLFDPAVFDVALKLPATKDPNFAKIKAEIPKVAEACKKASKYLHSFSSCADWKKLDGEIKKLTGAIVDGQPETITPAFAAALAGVAHLRDKNTFVRYAGLQIMERIFYDFSYKKVKKHRAILARVVANSVKNGTAYEERKQAIRVIGHDGGLSHFNGGVFDGKVLAWAAHKDKSKWVRRAALGNLASCIDRLKGKCPVKPSQIKTWIAAEKDLDARQGIAKLAGKLKMTDEVFAWCSPLLLDSTMYWGCRDGFKLVLDKAQFDKFHALAKKYRDSDGSKTANNFRMAFVVELMFHGLKNGFPRDKVVAFTDSILAQEETATKTSRGVVRNSINGLLKISKSVDEIKATRKLLKKRGRKFKKALRKNKDRKDWGKIFKEADKKLKEKLKAAKKAEKDKKDKKDK